MKSEPDFSNAVSITPSVVMEYLYCPRFIYFMECLKIPQHEQRRFKVQQGRKIHTQKEKLNPGYVRKKIACIRKEVSVYLSSAGDHLRGIVDEILFFEDGTLAPLEYKFASYHQKLFQTYKQQLVMQALLIEANYQQPVRKGFLIFIRSQHHLLTVPFTPADFETVKQDIARILLIIQRGFYPSRTRYRRRCTDCCYKNICV